MKDRLMLFLFRLLLRWDGWEPVDKGWRFQNQTTILGDGSEIARLVMRRLTAGERIRKNTYETNKQNVKPRK
jgi:hypothetical protein